MEKALAILACAMLALLVVRVGLHFFPVQGVDPHEVGILAAIVVAIVSSFLLKR